MSGLRRRRGMALLLVMAVISVLAAIATALHQTTMADWRLARRELDRVRARATAATGIELGRLLLAKDDRAYFWAPESREALLAPDGMTRVTSDLEEAYLLLAAADGEPMPMDGTGLTVRIEDESSRMNLNRAPGDHISRLLAVLAAPDPLAPRKLAAATANSSFEPQAGPSDLEMTGLAAALEDWRDGDPVARPGGAEMAEYMALEPVGYRPRDGALETVGELAWVKGFSTALDPPPPSAIATPEAPGPEVPVAAARPRLADLLTVHGLLARVNVNQALPEVLAAVPGIHESPLRRELITALKKERPLRDRVAIKAVLDQVDAGASAQALAWLDVRSDYFRIRARGEVPGGASYRIEAVLRKLPGGATQVVGWDEG